MTAFTGEPGTNWISVTDNNGRMGILIGQCEKRGIGIDRNVTNEVDDVILWVDFATFNKLIQKCFYTLVYTGFSEETWAYIMDRVCVC